MLDPVITWSLTADTQKTVKVGQSVLENVITNVHWRVTATDPETEASATLYGSKSLPLPDDPENFIDLESLQELDAEQRRLTVIGWAEAMDPGFVDGQTENVLAALAGKLAEPETGVVSIL